MVKLNHSFKRPTNAVGDHRPHRRAHLLLVLITALNFSCSSTGQPSQFDWRLIHEPP